MVAVTLLMITVTILVLTVWILKKEKYRRHIDQLGGPKSVPILGNLHQLKRNPSDFTKQLFEFATKYSHQRVHRLLIGYHPIVIVCSPEETEPLLNSSKHLDKSWDYNFLQPWLGTGLLLSTGEKWRSRRKLLTPTFHFKILEDFVDVFNEQSKVLLGKLRTRADGKSEINICSDITLCALDIICETAMGRCVNAQEDCTSDYVQAVYKLIQLWDFKPAPKLSNEPLSVWVSKYIFLRIRSPWLWPKFLFNLLGPGRDYDAVLHTLHTFTEKVIRERQQQFTETHNSDTSMLDLLDGQNMTGCRGNRRRLAFLDMLLCATSDSEKLSFSDIREEVDTFMFEGHDTTAMALNWTIHLIGSVLAVQQKVHEELDRIFGDSDRPATMEDLKEMKYLECCIKEALRILPSVPNFARCLSEDTQIAGMTLPKGTTVLVFSAAIHRRADIYPDPETYDPDRFLPENCQSRHPFAFIPFSAGSRNCIGQKFAILEEKVVLSTIFRNFVVKSTQSREELSPIIELIMRPANGISVILTPRSVDS